MLDYNEIIDLGKVSPRQTPFPPPPGRGYARRGGVGFVGGSRRKKLQKITLTQKSEHSRGLRRSGGFRSTKLSIPTKVDAW